MARQPLLECSFLIPLRRDANLSDGKRHQARCWVWLEEELYVFGGSSCSNATVSGCYEDPDTLERVWDESWRYSVGLPRRELPRLRALLAEVCQVFEQKCIYLSIAGHVEFVKRVRDE